MPNTKDSRKYKCSICQQKYSKIEEIRAHIKATHLVHVTCPLCDKIFASRIELFKHKKLHFQVTPDNPSSQKESNSWTSQATCKDTRQEGSLGLSKENAEADPSSCCSEVVPEASFSPHAISSLTTVSVAESAADLDTSKHPVFDSKNPTPKPKNSNGNALRRHHFKQRRDTNKSSARNNEAVEDIPLSSSSKKTICVPLGNHWEVTTISATRKWLETRANEDKSANTSTVPTGTCNEKCMVIPFEGTQFIQSPKIIGRPSGPVPASINKPMDYSKDNFQQSMEYNCYICHEKYDSIEMVQSHIKEIHVNLLICLLCDKKFDNRSQYVNHTTSHLDGSLASPKGSDQCSIKEDASLGIKKSITSKAEVNIISSRLEKSSKSRKTKEYKCKLCHEKYFHVEDVRAHVKKIHLAGLTCAVCDKIFPNKYSLSYHAKTHFCDIPNNVLMHSDESSDFSSETSPKISSKVKNTSFSGVSTDFGDSDLTDFHNSESHSSNQMHKDECHKCDKCNLFFDIESSLKLHQKTHKKALYKCGVCDFASFSKECVITHLSHECHAFQGEFNSDL